MKVPAIKNLSEIESQNESHGAGYEAEVALIGVALGSERLGYSVDVVKPGKKACPYHFHHVNEEMVFILEGMGTLRCAGREYEVKAGDFICIPAGPEYPHQISNTSSELLKYLSVSTMEHPDVIDYPDSEKYAVFVGRAPGGKEKRGSFCFIARKDAAVDYWEGED